MANGFNVRCTILNLLHCDLPSIKTSPFCHPTKKIQKIHPLQMCFRWWLGYVMFPEFSSLWTGPGISVPSRGSLYETNPNNVTMRYHFRANPSQNYHNISINFDFPPKNGCHLNDPTINRGGLQQKNNAQGRCLADALAPLPCGFGLLR